MFVLLNFTRTRASRNNRHGAERASAQNGFICRNDDDDERRWAVYGLHKGYLSMICTLRTQHTAPLPPTHTYEKITDFNQTNMRRIYRTRGSGRRGVTFTYEFPFNLTACKWTDCGRPIENFPEKCAHAYRTNE